MSPSPPYRSVPGTFLFLPRWFRLLALLLPVMACLAQGTSRPPTAPEPVLKAMLLVKILPFIQWPTNTFHSTNEPLVVVVLDAPAIHEELTRLATQPISGHPLVVHRSLTDCTNLHVLFFGRDHRRGIASYRAELEGRPVLTVGEQTGFADKGGFINILVKEDKPSLEIARDAAARVGLRFSSNLALLKSIHWIRSPESK